MTKDMCRLNQVITNITIHKKALVTLKAEYAELLGVVTEQDLKMQLMKHEMQGMKLNR